MTWSTYAGGNTLPDALQIATTDVTLDDLWRLDLSKMDGWTCIKVGSIASTVRTRFVVEAGSEENIVSTKVRCGRYGR